ncbi:TPA: PadR family transcriptional regulator [Candidatus Bathyarchaeota archaeon]|nr:PadR family transcriptional regulator [Candidatus Bathyarchaeota archaeon]
MFESLISFEEFPMEPTPADIAARWRDQMQKGYLKMAVLFVLMRKPLHGYEIMKEISKWTLGIITPTPGGVYPTLRELESRRLIEGEWIPEERRRTYRITSKGREVFKKAVEKHFELASSIRRWFFNELARLEIIDEPDLPPMMESAAKILLLKENASLQERIEALRRLRQSLQNTVMILSKMMEQIKLREEELKQGHNVYD